MSPMKKILRMTPSLIRVKRRKTLKKKKAPKLLIKMLIETLMWLTWNTMTLIFH
jgi:hypothetical protein